MTPTVAPAFLSSPKRKRENSELVKPFAPTLDTGLRASSPPFLSSGENSPRTKVANQLSELQLRNSISILEFGVKDGEKDRKKAKKLEDFPDIPTLKRPPNEMERDTIMVKAPTEEKVKSHNTNTPQPTDSNHSRHWHVVDEGRPDAAPAEHRANSQADKKNGSSPTLSPTPADLTWQEDEITGHLISPEDPDDDGTGINGIGFRPTPAIAYARSMRRKQQVLDWRAREAREARQKRWEGRRAAASRADERGDVKLSKGRSVKFAC